MLRPQKHTPLSESILGLSLAILDNLEKPMTPEDIYFEIRVQAIFKSHSFENVLYALDVLYLLNKVRLVDQGRVIKCA